MKNKHLSFILILLLCFQFVFSFLFPAVEYGSENWLPPAAYTSKFSPGATDNFLLQKIAPLFSRYRINSDVGGYLEVAGDFSKKEFANDPFLNRPLYPFLIFLSSLPLRAFGISSFGLLFVLGILINFLFAAASVILLFLLVEKFLNRKVAFLSSSLLIFSPLVHSFGPQILPETLTLFYVILSFYLLDNYVKRPTDLKLALFSFVLGVLFLGKMFFALPLFILALALLKKRFREAGIFALLFLLPFWFWFSWVTKVWGINYYCHEVQHWQQGIWVLDMFKWPWHKTGQVLLRVVPEFIQHLIYSFMFLPLVFVVGGWNKLSPRIKNFFLGFGLCLFLQGFLVGFYYRHTFMLFLFVYPACCLGIERAAHYLKKYRPWFSPLVWTIAIALILVVSNINIYKIFPYNN